MSEVNAAKMLMEYHRCVRFFNDGCRKLERELKALGLPLEFANRWTHHEGVRVGVLFYDKVQSRNRWLSVPIIVFNMGSFKAFAEKYCKIESDGDTTY